MGIVEYNFKLKKKREKEIRKELERIKKIIPKLEVEKAILFGSSARKEIGISSDIDLIIILKDSKLPFLERLKEFYKKINPEISMDILVYTLEEFEKIKESLFGKEIIKDGIVLYER